MNVKFFKSQHNHEHHRRHHHHDHGCESESTGRVKTQFDKTPPSTSPSRRVLHPGISTYSQFPITEVTSAL